jgi:hypothetical protein
MVRKTILGVEKIKTEYPILHILLILLTLAVVFLAGVCIVEVVGARNTDMEPLNVFIDLLYINLTVAAVLISVLSYCAYKFLGHQLEKKTEAFFADKESLLFGQSFSSISFAHFSHYETSKDGNHLDLAINMASKAFARVKTLDMSKTENLKLYCDVINNLSYYYAEKGDINNRTVALKYADILESNLHLFPEKNPEIWVDTVRFIRRKYNEEAIKLQGSGSVS